jgi:hypothetical protein
MQSLHFPVNLVCGANVNIGPCPVNLDSDFSNWLATFSVSGGTGTVTVTYVVNGGVVNLSDLTAPDYCGGSITVEALAIDECEVTATCSGTFTVTAAPAIVLTCATNATEAACQSQQDIDDAFALWLATTTASGGCNTTLTNDNTGAPSACGGSVTVTWTATDDCNQTETCSATFTVTAAPAIVLTCATNATEVACQSQQDIDDAFALWLATTTASGGCNTTLTNDNTGAPSACGGSVTVTWTATDDCNQTETCSATFTVTAAPAIVLTCATNATEVACQSQQDIDDAFALWLATTTASGGCNTTLTNDNTGAPSACGGSVTVTWTATDDCNQTETCSATFTVTAAPAIELNVPADYLGTACMSQAEVDAAFAAWLASASISGGCNLSVASSVDTPPSACGSVTTLTLSAISACEADTSASATFTVPVPDAIVAICPAPVVMPPCATMNEILAAYEAWKNDFDYSGECFVSDNMDDFPAMNIEILTGGTITFTYMVTGTCSEDLCTSSFTIPPCDNGGCTLSPGYWKTHSEFGPAPYDPTWGLLPNGASTIFFLSGKTYHNVMWTPPAGNAYYNLSFQYIATELNFLNGADPTAAQAAFNTATILFNTYTPAQIKNLKGNNPLRKQFLTLASILDAYNNGQIGPGYCNGNNGGDKSSIVIADDVEKATTVNVYPNPVSESATIEFTSSKDARTTVELYNLMGQKMEILFDAFTNQGMTYQAALNARSYQNGLYIVVIRTDNSIYNKKVSISN